MCKGGVSLWKSISLFTEYNEIPDTELRLSYTILKGSIVVAMNSSVGVHKIDIHF